MVNKLITALIMIVIGLALLPVVTDFVDGLTGTGMAYESTTLGSLIDVIPILYVIIIVAGAAAYVYFATSRTGK